MDADLNRKVAIIGAGPSGLVACKVMREYGFSATCFEAGNRVGGQWVIENSSGTSACYRSVVTNTHRGMIRFSDFEPDSSLPDFPSHVQMAEYFESYAREFELFDAVQFSSRVTSVHRLTNGQWQIETDRRNVGNYDALIVCTGRFGKPQMPNFSGEFSGSIFHSQDYLGPEEPVDCQDRNVLIVGLGNTACDLAVELSAPGMAKRVFLSARSGAHIIPRRPNGKLAPTPHPADKLPRALRYLPPRLRAALMRAVLPAVFRYLQRGQITLEEVNLPPPLSPPNPRNIVANDSVLERLRESRIEARPAVRTLNGGEVEFVDGSVDEVDVVIAATGYDISLPFFAPELRAGVEELQLYRGLMHPKQHNLYFLGFIMGLCSNWPFSEQQAIWVANHLSGRVALPEDAKISKYLETPAALSRKMLNCQFMADELHRDYQLR